MDRPPLSTHARGARPPGKAHHRGRCPRPLASHLGLPAPTAPDTAACALVTHWAGGGRGQTCRASGCPAASQCPGGEGPGRSQWHFPAHRRSDLQGQLQAAGFRGPDRLPGSLTGRELRVWVRRSAGRQSYYQSTKCTFSTSTALCEVSHCKPSCSRKQRRNSRDKNCRKRFPPTLILFRHDAGAHRSAACVLGPVVALCPGWLLFPPSPPGCWRLK